MGEKETASAEEAELLKNKTKSNQSNDRSAQEAGLVPGEEAELLKNKTKSNQSNDRLDQGDSGALDPDSDDDGIEDGSAERTDVTEQATWTTSNPGIKTGPASSDSSAGKVSMQDMQLAQSAIKNGPRQTADREGTPDSGGPQPIDVDDDGDSLAESKFYDQKTNDKGREQASGGGDSEQSAAKLAPERPVRSDIAIGDPGVNGNLEVDDGGGSDEGAALRNPRAGYDIKTNTK